MASKPTEMCVIETTGAREYKVRMKSSLFVTRVRLFRLSVSRSLFATNARWIIIFHRGSLLPSFLSIIFFSSRHLLDDDALFNPARFEKTRENASSSRKKMKTCLSLCLSVCLSLSLARVVAKKSKRHATKKRRLRVVVSQPLKKKQSHQIRA